MRRLRQIRPNQLVEVTCRIAQGRYLLRPSDELNRHFLGVLGRAQRRASMKIHAVAVMSNHYHLLLSPRDALQLARFMQHLQGNLSKEIKIVQRWDGPVWDGRYQSIEVADEEEAQIARLRYVLAQGVKEDLVERVRDWPGIHCARALLDGEALRGTWYDRSRLAELERRVRKPSQEEVAQAETVALSPLPCWEGLPEEEIRENVAALVEAIEIEAAERRAAEGRRVVGASRVRRTPPPIARSGLPGLPVDSFTPPLGRRSWSFARRMWSSSPSSGMRQSHYAGAKKGRPFLPAAFHPGSPSCLIRPPDRDGGADGPDRDGDPELITVGELRPKPGLI